MKIFSRDMTLLSLFIDKYYFIVSKRKKRATEETLSRGVKEITLVQDW